MEQLWFDARFIDTATKQPLSDEAAAPLIEAGCTTIEPLGELLLASEFPLTRADFRDEMALERMRNIRQWGPEQCHAFGSWLRSLVEIEGEAPPQITVRHIRRLNIMRLGPNEGPLFNQSGVSNLYEFRDLIGSPVRAAEKFSDWDTKRYARHAEAVAAQVGRRPQWDDYDAAAKAAGYTVPHAKAIAEGFDGGVEQLNEIIGYPDIDAMDEVDIAVWGARVKRANDGVPLSYAMVRVLSERDRGPGVNFIKDKLGSWSKFIYQAEQQYKIEQDIEQRERETKLAQYAGMITSGELPPVAAQLDADMLIKVGGRFLVAQRCAPDLTREQMWTFARTIERGVVPMLQWYRKKIDPRAIELAAEALRVADDIMPNDDGSKYLVVSKRELAELRERDNARARAYRERRKAAQSAEPEAFDEAA